MPNGRTFSPQFSRRTGWDRTQNAFAGVSPRIDLTESNPARAGLFDARPFVAELGHARGAQYEPRPFGDGSAREAVAAYYAARGQRVEPSRVVLTASTSESYAWLFKVLCD